MKPRSLISTSSLVAEQLESRLLHRQCRPRPLALPGLTLNLRPRAWEPPPTCEQEATRRKFGAREDGPVQKARIPSHDEN